MFWHLGKGLIIKGHMGWMPKGPHFMKVWSASAHCSCAVWASSSQRAGTSHMFWLCSKQEGFPGQPNRERKCRSLVQCWEPGDRDPAWKAKTLCPSQMQSLRYWGMGKLAVLDTVSHWKCQKPGPSWQRAASEASSLPCPWPVLKSHSVPVPVLNFFFF